MKQTDNFNLPLIELEDNYDIEVFNEGNRITDTQLKALKDIADSWIAFKSNGGEINGNITINNEYPNTSKSKAWIGAGTVNGNGLDPVVSLGTTNNLTKATTMVEVAQPNNLPYERSGEGYFGSSHDLKTMLGSDVRRWKDVWVGEYSKQSNGFTKLPNGMIMQWGTVSASFNQGLYRSFINYPVNFANKPLSILSNVNQIGAGEPLQANTQAFYQEDSTVGFSLGVMYNQATNNAFVINWFAIGY